MKIQQHYHRESGFSFEISVESKDTETHVALTDLKDYHRDLIKTHMFQLGQLVEKLLVANRETRNDETPL